MSNEHIAEFVGLFCPLCKELGADQYLDHGGLCVCQHCGQTFDPEIEPFDEDLPPLKAEGDPDRWRGVDRQDKKDRLQLRRLETTRARNVLRNVDGLRRLRAIPDREWARAVAEDEANAAP